MVKAVKRKEYEIFESRSVKRTREHKETTELVSSWYETAKHVHKVGQYEG